MDNNHNEIILFSSNPVDNGYEYNPQTGEYEYKDGDDIYVWDFENEYYGFVADFKPLIDKAPGLIATGLCTDWQGTGRGGKAFVGTTFEKVFGSFWNNVDAYGCLVVKDIDGELVIETSNHDGGMTMTVRELTDKGATYYYNHPYDAPSELNTHLFDTKGLSRPFRPNEKLSEA